MKYNKNFLIEMCAYFRQAERSVDRVIFGGWNKLQEYYETKTSRGEKILRILRNDLSCDERGHNLLDGLSYESEGHKLREEIIEKIQNKSMIVNLFQKTIALITGKYSFNSKEISFLIQTLEDFLKYLQQNKKPKSDDLTNLLKSLRLSWIIVEQKAYSRLMRKAIDIEHFGQPEFLKLYSFEEIL